MKNFIQKGHNLNFIASGDVKSGDPVVVGDIVGIATGDVSNGKEGVLSFRGVYELASVSNASFDQGDLLYWDASAKNVTKIASSHKKIGYAAAAKAETATSCRVLLSR